ncbi:beta strand repeat-containing protein, partial [Bathymodiolus heckerae thiotrophic gill symbiont]|uniref:beta strand repeat-containing protein n=1 Tax=Bathymodiolus heckerae thiotrophic gill symbiont TaxID=1052212 RepID=UPI0010FCDBD9
MKTNEQFVKSQAKASILAKEYNLKTVNIKGDSEHVRVQPGIVYEISVENDGILTKNFNLIAKRVGNDLEVLLEDSIVIFDEYFEICGSDLSCIVSLPTENGNLYYVTEGNFYTLTDGSQIVHFYGDYTGLQSILSGQPDLFADSFNSTYFDAGYLSASMGGGGLLGLAGLAGSGSGSGSGGGSGSGNNDTSNVVAGFFSAGKYSGIKIENVVELYDKNGNLLAKTTLEADGSYSFSTSYTGAVYLKLNRGLIYKDELTNADKILSTDLFAVSVISTGAPNKVNINVQTSIAAKLAGVDSTTIATTITLDESEITQSNQRVTDAFALEENIVKANIDTVNSQGDENGSKESGYVAAALSGMESIAKYTNTQDVIEAVAGAIDKTGGLNKEISDDLLTGANAVKVTFTDTNYNDDGAKIVEKFSDLEVNFSNIQISSTNNGIFVTTDASTQNITATLDTALVSQKLWGSVDNGKTWEDITSSVAGIQLTWNKALQVDGGAIKFAVTADSESTVTDSNTVDGTAMQKYTLNAITLLSAVDLDPTQANAQSSSSTIVNSANRATTLATGIAFDAEIAAPTETDIAQIKIVLGGLDTTNDKLILNTADINTNADITATTLTIASVAASYTLTGNTLVITKADGSNFSVANVKTIVEAIRLKNAEASPSEGDRTATISYINAGNSESSPATASIKVNLIAPDAVDLDAIIVGTQATEALAINIVNQSQLKVGIAFEANVGTPTATDITQIKVAIGGTNLDTTNDQLLLGLNYNLDLSSNAQGNNISLGAITGINYTYNKTNNTLIVSKDDASVLSATEVQTIIANIKLQNTTQNPTQGDRTATFSYIDAAGNEGTSAITTLSVDTIAPAQIDLGDSEAGIQNSSTTIVNNTNLATTLATGIAFDASIVAPTESDIAQIKIVLGGLDTTNDKLILNTANINTNADITATTLTIASVAASYTLTGNTLVITKADGSNFSTANVKAIVEAIRLKNVETRPSEGDRTATFTYTDEHGNTSASATATISIDLTAPDAVDLDATASIQDTSLFTTNREQLAQGVAFDAAIATPTVTDIIQIKVVIGGTNLDTINDHLLLGLNNQVALNVNSADNKVSLGGLTGINYTYNATTKTLILSKADGTNLSTLEVQQVIQSIKLQNTTTNAAEGDRTATFSYVDVAGNEGASATATVSVDAAASSLSAVDLDPTQANVQSSSSTIVSSANRATTLATGIAFDAEIAAPTETDITQIKIVLGGLDTAKDKLILNTADINTNADITATTLTIASVATSYTLTGNTLVITKADGSNFSTANVKAIVEAIRLKNVETSPSEGDRTATFTYTDEHGNTNASATATISVNLIAPDAVDLDATASIQDTSLFTTNREQLAQGVAFDAAIAAPTATDIIQIKVVIGGTGLDATNDHLLLGLNNQVA